MDVDGVVPAEVFNQGAREKGKILLGGKDYIMKDGDVVFFKVRV